MSATSVILRTQTELLDSIERQMRDVGNARWTDDEIYQAINEALLEWWDRVRLPHLYTITGGWQSDTFEYALPAYVRPPLTPQIQVTALTYYGVSLDDDTTYTWMDIAAYDVEPDGDGGLKLRLGFAPPEESGRILYYLPNGAVPLTVPTLSADMTAAGTSATLGSVVTCEDTGWVKIDSEWMSYSGVTRGASTTTLSNLERGIYSTTAATHDGTSTPASVYWGIGVDNLGLFQQLYDNVRAKLHAYFLSDASVQETSRHEKLMNFYQQKADAFWRRYVPGRRPRMVLTREGLGPQEDVL